MHLFTKFLDANFSVIVYSAFFGYVIFAISPQYTLKVDSISGKLTRSLGLFSTTEFSTDNVINNS